MTGPVVPPGGEELREALAEALPEALGPAGLRRPAIPELGVESSITGFGVMVIDALLPTVLAAIDAEGRRRAAEEIEAAADSLTDRVRTWVLNLLRDRAAALAPENEDAPVLPERCTAAFTTAWGDRRCDLPAGHEGLHTRNDGCGRPEYVWMPALAPENARPE